MSEWVNECVAALCIWVYRSSEICRAWTRTLAGHQAIVSKVEEKRRYENKSNLSMPMQLYCVRYVYVYSAAVDNTQILYTHSCLSLSLFLKHTRTHITLFMSLRFSVAVLYVYLYILLYFLLLLLFFVHSSLIYFFFCYCCCFAVFNFGCYSFNFEYVCVQTPNLFPFKTMSFSWIIVTCFRTWQLYNHQHIVDAFCLNANLRKTKEKLHHKLKNGHRSTGVFRQRFHVRVSFFSFILLILLIFTRASILDKIL